MPTQSAIDLAFLDEMPANFALHFLNRVKATPNAEAFRYPVVGSTTEAGGEEWKSLTWKEASDLASRLAAGLVSLGLELEQRVGIASTTRYE